jgi:hypothetical protein
MTVLRVLTILLVLISLPLAFAQGVRGRVLNSHGDPVEDVHVLALSEDEDGGEGERGWDMTNTEGEFDIPFTSGEDPIATLLFTYKGDGSDCRAGIIRFNISSQEQHEIYKIVGENPCDTTQGYLMYNPSTPREAREFVDFLNFRVNLHSKGVRRLTGGWDDEPGMIAAVINAVRRALPEPHIARAFTPFELQILDMRLQQLEQQLEQMMR